MQKLPKVNRQLAEKLLEESSKPAKKKTKKGQEEPEQVGENEKDVANPLGDPRFAAMFSNTDFEVDTESEAFQRLHPILSHREKRRSKKQVLEATNAKKEGEEEEVWQCNHCGRGKLVCLLLLSGVGRSTQ